MNKTDKTYDTLKKESVYLINKFITAASNGQLTSQQLHSLRRRFFFLKQIELILKNNEKWERYRNRTHSKTIKLIKKHREAFLQAIRNHCERVKE